MGRSSEKFIREREREADSMPLALEPVVVWEEYFGLLGQQYTTDYKLTKTQ